MTRVVALAVVMLGTASLQTSAQNRLAFGVGIANSCGVWMQARQTRSGNNEKVLTQWVAGHLSGLNMDTAHPDALLGTDFDGLMGWIDNYCKANPLDKVATAAGRLFDELRSRAQRR